MASPEAARLRQLAAILPRLPRPTPLAFPTPEAFGRAWMFANAYMAGALEAKRVNWRGSGVPQDARPRGAVGAFGWPCGCNWYDPGCLVRCAEHAIGDAERAVLKAVNDAAAAVAKAAKDAAASVAAAERRAAHAIADAEARAQDAVVKGAADTLRATKETLAKFDPTSTAGREIIAGLFPWPLSAALLDSGALINCLKGVRKGDWTAGAICIGQFLIDVLKDIILDDRFQLMLSMFSGNVPRAVRLAIRIIVRTLLDGLDNPQLQRQLGLSSDQAQATRAVLLILLNAEDFVRYIFENNGGDWSSRVPYLLLGATLYMGAAAQPQIAIIADALTYNAEIFAALVRGNTGEAKKLFATKYAGVRDVSMQQARSMQVAAYALAGIGILLENVGDGIDKLPLMRGIGDAVKSSGRVIKVLGLALVSPIMDVAMQTGAKGTAVDEIARAREDRDAAVARANADRDAARHDASTAGTERDAAVARQHQLEDQLAALKAEADRRAAAAKNAPLVAVVPTVTPTSPPATTSKKSAWPWVGAGAGFLVGGPVGAGAGFVIGSGIK